MTVAIAFLVGAWVGCALGIGLVAVLSINGGDK